MFPETATTVMVEGEDFVANLDELASLADALGARANTLSLLPEGGNADGAARAKARFDALDAATQRRLAVALAVLRAPGKMAHWNHTIADETVSRAALAWSASVPDSIVALAGTADPRRISFWTEKSVAASIRKTLAADRHLTGEDIGCKLSTNAVVVFLAALDYVRAARLHSLLTHTAPSASFSQAEIMDRLRDASSEDFRWPLLFVEKLLPGRLVTSLSEIEVAGALGELAQAGLIGKASEGRVLRYELSAIGTVISDGVVHDVSKVALGVTDQQADGKLGRDVMLLVRSGFHLFLFAMAGPSGAIAALAEDELAAALHFALRPAVPPPAAAPEPAPAQAAAPPPVPSKQWYFTRAGQTEGPMDERALRAMLPSLPADTMVWNAEMPNWMTAAQAGLVAAAAPAACPHCGAPSQPGQRFCMNCGRPQ